MKNGKLCLKKDTILYLFLAIILSLGVTFFFQASQQTRSLSTRAAKHLQTDLPVLPTATPTPPVKKILIAGDSFVQFGVREYKTYYELLLEKSAARFSMFYPEDHPGYSSVLFAQELTQLEKGAIHRWGDNKPYIRRYNDLTPDILILRLGTNDILFSKNMDESVASLNTIIKYYEDLNSRSNLTVIIDLVPNVIHTSGTITKSLTEINATQDVLNSKLKALAQNRRIYVTSGVAFSSADVAPDGYHPSQSGVVLLTDSVLKILSEIK